jgi:polar amino acid transport system ATP-binding protein
MRIALRGITRRFEGRTVLQDVDYEEDFDSLAVIGPSGGGKSTLLRIIGGLLAPDAGELLLDGAKVDFREKPLRAHRRGIGFVFQARGLYEHLTAMENMVLPLVHTFGIARTAAVDQSRALLARFGLEGEADKHPFELSGGQQQRIAIARAIAVRPQLLLLDEPTSALDPEYTAEVLDMLRELQAEGLRTILVTHEMGFAKNACEKALFLADGRIVESGDSARMFRDPGTPALASFLDKVLEWKV